jgi:hypothetical protein
MFDFATISEDHAMKRMSLEHAVEAFAGFMVLLSVGLTQWAHPGFMWLTVFVGANLFQQSFTGFCPAAIVMQKVFGLKTEKQLSIEQV